MTSPVFVAALLAAAVLGFVALAERSVGFQDVEFWAYDFLINHGGYAPASRSIVIVDFDDVTFDRLHQYPIPRQAFASVIARVAAGSPRVIGLDLFLSEARTPAEDAAFRQAIAGAGNVVLASQADAGGIPSVRPLPMFCEPEEVEAPSGFCREQSGGALGYAFVNLPVESDGFVRRFLLFSPGAHPGVSFAATLAQQYAGEPLKPLDADRVSFLGKPIAYADPADRTVWIGAWRRQIAPTVSAIDLLQPGAATAYDFRDKIVLIGQSHDAARDRFQTPLFRPAPADGSSRVRLAGVALHAAAVETLLTGRPIVALPRRATLLVLLLLCFSAVWMVLRFDLGPAAGAVLLQVVAIYAGAQLLLSWQHVWVRYASLIVGTAASVPAALGYRFVRERLLRSAATKEREQIMGLFGRYVSPEVAQEIWARRDELVLAGEERVATVLFSDIRGFTAMTAGKPSIAVLRWLNDYLTAMDEVIRAHGGFLNKFIGDGIMVLFGVPLSDGAGRDAARAARAALAMLDRLDQLNREAGPITVFGPVHIGIGLHTGTLTSGNVGSNDRLEYSVIGETVNLASRLESLTKEFHTPIVMSGATAEAIRDAIPGVRPLGDAAVRGFSERMPLYTIERDPGGNA